MIPIAAVLTDIEGTTTPIAFVRDKLFPFARTRLPGFLAEHGHEPAVAAEFAEVGRLAPETAPLDALLKWMDQDAKVTPLKTLQGMIWADGYASGALLGDLYPDVAPCLRRWSDGGMRLFVYSSGSVEAQRLIFGHSVAGDLTPLFAGFFDTRIGGKRDAASYDRIAIAIGIGVPAAEVLFLSDIEAELDAAAAAGLRTCQVVRPEDGTQSVGTHPVAGDFNSIAGQFSLPD